MSNPLDTKPFNSKLTGKGVKTKQHFKPNSNLSGYGKGSDVTVKTNKLALPVTRTGSSTGKLVKRTQTDCKPGLQGGLRETGKLLSDINEFCEGFKPDPFHALVTKVRHARKTGDKAAEALAKDELERLAARFGKQNDPEVLDALT